MNYFSSFTIFLFPKSHLLINSRFSHRQVISWVLLMGRLPGHPWFGLVLSLLVPPGLPALTGWWPGNKSYPCRLSCACFRFLYPRLRRSVSTRDWQMRVRSSNSSNMALWWGYFQFPTQFSFENTKPTVALPCGSVHTSGVLSISGE